VESASSGLKVLNKSVWVPFSFATESQAINENSSPKNSNRYGF
jgi:hypothetical protein